MPNELTNPTNVVTEERLAQFYQQILPYLGGMPDILANKFSKADLYSTDEKLIGRWIDGKPLYQKTFTGLSKTLSSSWNTIVTIPDIDEVIHLDVKYSDSPKSTIGEIEYGPNHNTNGIEVVTTGPNRTINTATVQYTKTTDSAVEIGDDTDYNTTEKIVGTWIDGKPIWQKTVTSFRSNLSSGWANILLISDISSDLDTPISVEATTTQSGKKMVLDIRVQTAGDYLQGYVSGITSAPIETLTLYYTKTSS